MLIKLTSNIVNLFLDTITSDNHDVMYRRDQFLNETCDLALAGDRKQESCSDIWRYLTTGAFIQTRVRVHAWWWWYSSAALTLRLRFIPRIVRVCQSEAVSFLGWRVSRHWDRSSVWTNGRRGSCMTRTNEREPRAVTPVLTWFQLSLTNVRFLLSLCLSTCVIFVKLVIFKTFLYCCVQSF